MVTASILGIFVLFILLALAANEANRREVMGTNAEEPEHALPRSEQDEHAA